MTYINNLFTNGFLNPKNFTCTTRIPSIRLIKLCTLTFKTRENSTWLTVSWWQRKKRHKVNELSTEEPLWSSPVLFQCHLLSLSTPNVLYPMWKFIPTSKWKYALFSPTFKSLHFCSFWLHGTPFLVIRINSYIFFLRPAQIVFPINESSDLPRLRQMLAPYLSQNTMYPVIKLFTWMKLLI